MIIHLSDDFDQDLSIEIVGAEELHHTTTLKMSLNGVEHVLSVEELDELVYLVKQIDEIDNKKNIKNQQKLLDKQNEDKVE